MAQQPSFDFQTLIQFITDRTNTVKTKLNEIKSQGSSVSIGDMFEMQFDMNMLSQASEASSSIISAANTAILSMARNTKG